ncbi:hypothetical protein F5I97DRAFT_1829578 [Phlebopus sp. FC_14]|nr:hypothetical protein F5I97DRAFT_1829578 [Phlebopus sp. FC_14]
MCAMLHESPLIAETRASMLGTAGQRPRTYTCGSKRKSRVLLYYVGPWSLAAILGHIARGSVTAANVKLPPKSGVVCWGNDQYISLNDAIEQLFCFIAILRPCDDAAARSDIALFELRKLIWNVKYIDRIAPPANELIEQGPKPLVKVSHFTASVFTISMLGPARAKGWFQPWHEWDVLPVI